MSAAASVAGVMLAILVRQLFVLAAAGRSRRFLRRGTPATSSAATTGKGEPYFFVVVPVLREAAVIAEAIDHFEAMTNGHAAQLVVVTTMRETAESVRHHDSNDTITVVGKLAAEHNFLHLHYPDPLGLKADQLNYAAAQCTGRMPADVPACNAYLVCYDADSRPPPDSLAHFAHAAERHPGVSVFHQSSRFELRTPANPHTGDRLGRLSHAVCDGGALRANRFVVGFEIPRLLNRTTAVGSAKRAACSYVYAHVTTHGLCVRLPLLLELPFPARSPLEDMHYSFHLGSRNEPMVPVPSLDRAEVPNTVRAQVQQASRWFFGPARFLQYLEDPATQPGMRAHLQGISAFGSALEWLGCAVVPAATLLLVIAGDGLSRFCGIAVSGVYLLQLLVADQTLGAPAPIRRRVVRVLACPLATTLFGVGGVIGAARLVAGGTGVGKTERRPA